MTWQAYMHAVQAIQSYADVSLHNMAYWRAGHACPHNTRLDTAVSRVREIRCRVVQLWRQGQTVALTPLVR